MAGLTLEQLQAQGAVPHEEAPSQARGLTLAQLQAQGAVPHPETAPAAPPPMSVGKAMLKGLQDIPTFGFGDEAGARIQGELGRAREVLAHPMDTLKASAAAPTWQDMRDTAVRALSMGLYDPAIARRPDYQKALAENRAESKQARDEQPIAYYGTGLPAAIATSALTAPFRAAQGASLGARALAAAGNGLMQGALTGAGESEATTLGGVARDTALSGLAGAGLAGALGAAGGAVGKAAAGKVAGIDEAVARKAAEAAAGETASTRSAAGAAAQDAYRQLEHLRELKAVGNLTPAQAQAAQQLEVELAQKAQEKLLPAAQRKAATALEYQEALQTEGQRASQMAADKLSANEALQQLKARAVRYGLPALSGAVLGGLGFGGHGALAGAALGGALGNNFRPMLHSLVRMAGQPSVQRPLYSALAGTAERATPALERVAAEPAEGLAQWLAAHIVETPALAEEDKNRYPGLTAALNRRGP